MLYRDSAQLNGFVPMVVGLKDQLFTFMCIASATVFFLSLSSRLFYPYQERDDHREGRRGLQTTAVDRKQVKNFIIVPGTQAESAVGSLGENGVSNFMYSDGGVKGTVSAGNQHLQTPKYFTDWRVIGIYNHNFSFS